MIISCSCSPNIFSPLPASSSSSFPTTTTKVAREKKERSWSNQSMLGLTCIIVGFEMNNLVCGVDLALSEEMKQVVLIELSSEKAGAGKMMRWSDKRSCQPWRRNDLEIIVPENLPRPSAAARRWEAIGSTKRTAPAVKGGSVRNISNSRNSCFSM